MNTDIVPPPVTDVKQPPVEAAPEITAQPEPASAPVAQKSAPKPPKSKKGTGAAIAATVVIVLGLGLLATYAYLQTR